MNALDAWAMTPDDYSQWETIAVAVLFVMGMVWLFMGFPSIPRDWLHDDWRR